MVGILTTMFKRPSRQSLLDFEVALSYIFVDSTLRSFTHLTDTVNPFHSFTRSINSRRYTWLVS